MLEEFLRDNEPRSVGEHLASDSFKKELYDILDGDFEFDLEHYDCHDDCPSEDDYEGLRDALQDIELILKSRGGLEEEPEETLEAIAEIIQDNSFRF